MNELISLSTLFNNKIFRIPDYQRGYAWNIKQLTDFWDDIMTLSVDRYHYTGMISLKKLKSDDYRKWDDEKWLLERTSDPFEAYHVVDGQQRLTTFVILINVIIQFVTKECIRQNEKIRDIRLGGYTLEEILIKYIKESRKSLISKETYKFGYEIDNPSFLFMKHQILGEPNSGTLEETFYTINLQMAKDFFEDRVKDIYLLKGFESLDAIFVKLTKKLKFNIHNIDDEFDVFVAFETMNNRGKKLSNLEILKNRLIYLTTLYPDTLLTNYDKTDLRNEINDAWKEIYRQLGRNKDRPLDDDEYLRAHWTMFFKYSRNKRNDYVIDLLDKKFNPKPVMLYSAEKIGVDSDKAARAFNDDVTQIDKYDDGFLEPIEIKEYVGSLKSLAQYWFYTYFPRLNTRLTEDEKIWIERLNRIGIPSFRTLVASTIYNNNSPHLRIKLFKAIERFIFVCFRLGGYNSSYKNTDFFRYAREQFLRSEGSDINDIAKNINSLTDYNISESLANFKNRVDKWFQHEGYYSWDYLKYFLFEYEYEKVKSTGIEKFGWDHFIKSERDKTSIEHIFPQTPTKWYWENLYKKYTDKEKLALSGSLGNLLPLSQSINSSLQNDEFELKKNPTNDQRLGYSNNSYSAIEISHHNDWSSENILHRGITLLNFMEERWNFRFESEEVKKSLLHIDFVEEAREISIEPVNIENEGEIV